MPENKRIELVILSPEGEIFRGGADEVTVPSAQGEITILPNHTALFTKLGEGEAIIKTGGEKTMIAMTGGFLEVLDNKVNIMADYAVRSESIEAAKAEEARKKAEEILREKEGKKDLVSAERDLKRALLHLKVSQQVRKRRTNTPRQ